MPPSQYASSLADYSDQAGTGLTGLGSEVLSAGLKFARGANPRWELSRPVKKQRKASEATWEGPAPVPTTDLRESILSWLKQHAVTAAKERHTIPEVRACLDLGNEIAIVVKKSALKAWSRLQPKSVDVELPARERMVPGTNREERLPHEDQETDQQFEDRIFAGLWQDKAETFFACITDGGRLEPSPISRSEDRLPGDED